MLPVLSAQNRDGLYKIKKQTRISSGLDEAGAVPYEDDIVYISEATSVGASSPRDSKGRRLFTMFRVTPGSGQKKQFIDQLVSQGHEGPVTFTGDYKTMVFAQQRPADGNRGSDPLGLYFAENTNGEPYSVTNIAGYTYTWTITGGTQASGGTTNSITINKQTDMAGRTSRCCKIFTNCPGNMIKIPFFFIC